MYTLYTYVYPVYPVYSCIPCIPMYSLYTLYTDVYPVYPAFLVYPCILMYSLYTHVYTAYPVCPVYPVYPLVKKSCLIYKINLLCKQFNIENKSVTFKKILLLSYSLSVHFKNHQVNLISANKKTKLLLHLYKRKKVL